MAWQENALMFWSNDNGSTWHKITDHGRDPMSISVERIEKKNRMADGTLRRQTVAKKRTFSVGWAMLPSRRNPSRGGVQGLSTVDNGWAGEEIEQFYNDVDGRFLMKIRRGNDDAKAITDGTIEVVAVMFADFSKEIEKRGIVDFWSLNISLEEV